MLHIRHLFIHLSSFPCTLDASWKRLGIPHVPCLFHDFHLQKPLPVVHLHRIHMLLVQSPQRLDNPRLAIPLRPPLLDRDQREMRLQRPKIIWRHPSNQVGAPLLFPLGVTIVDDVLSEVPGLQAAADLVKVANPAPGRRRDEDGPVVKSDVAIRAVASGKLDNLNREVARRDLDPGVPGVFNFVLGLRCRSKTRGVGCGAGTKGRVNNV